MKNLNSIRNTFVRQSAQSDCGLACLAMVLIYSGRKNDAASLLMESRVPENGLSLLEMRRLAERFGLTARCVSMDVATLRRTSCPSILHIIDETGDPHFMVCYGGLKKGRSWQYFVADPARKMHFISEDDLTAAWKSNAALYFEDILFKGLPCRERAWMPLLTIRSFPKGLWFSIPFLNVCITLLGIALSWVLQRGIEDSLTGKKQSLVIAVLLLLLIITIFKSMIAYIKQRVLIKLNNAVNEQYLTSYIRKIVYKQDLPQAGVNNRTLKIHLTDIQKIQNAVSGFASVMLSEGVLILLVLSGVIYTEPVAGLINAGYLIAMLIVAAKNSPEIAYQTACLNEMSGRAENQLSDELKGLFGKMNPESRLMHHHRNHHQYLSSARQVATRISRYNLFYECTGALNVLIVFSVCIFKMEKMEMSYGILMILVISSYFIAVLIQKICNAIVVITEGADASRQFSLNCTQKQH
ncbi:cysteine peptidase family C39 domain-containing protein [Mucilaginibacter gotjawali]|uniref:Lactococcin-G-processing and transport ATP-binding protein LagD n=2 Tax=Mucilaginibacter gotjawali TaxID=1550579 RepID=A0A110AZS4_9SPHI|nr:cysteine peptidase family C39 domain-containing protein [Mucilaginibacter gotjawali]MBB3054224.1 ABC-type bacteriocin/lantibiotic exporter with double-glycine peptidase domain [Mucilaginibacter gotjawali]BAU51943.1 Lactococcin-G-processing and transport ATP-binding protein LagD [Mucilaginibacter gotjawali]